jgi:hypothetical protein
LFAFQVSIAASGLQYAGYQKSILRISVVRPHIDYTPALENSLLDILAEMRRDEVDRSRESATRGARCG